MSLTSNGTLDAAEQCDGQNLNSATCETLEFSPGTLGCSGNWYVNGIRVPSAWEACGTR